MADKKLNSKAVWSIRVQAGLKQWFEEFAKLRQTDSQEEARRALADFRMKHEITDKKQEPEDGETLPLCNSGEG